MSIRTIRTGSPISKARSLLEKGVGILPEEPRRSTVFQSIRSITQEFWPCGLLLSAPTPLPSSHQISSSLVRRIRSRVFGEDPGPINSVNRSMGFPLAISSNKPACGCNPGNPFSTGMGRPGGPGSLYKRAAFGRLPQNSSSDLNKLLFTVGVRPEDRYNRRHEPQPIAGLRIPPL